MRRMPRRSRGRQKIEMVKIKNEANLAVAFSKRRLSVFKSASEMCSLAGAEVALIVFSPGNMPFSFGCPNVPSIIKKYQNPGFRPHMDIIEQLQRTIDLERLNQEIMLLEKMVEEEKKRGKAIDRRIKERQSKHWWEVPCEVLNLDQLEQLKVGLENLRMMNLPNELQAKTDVHDILVYQPNTYVGGPPYGTLPPTLNGGIFVGGASSSTMAQSNQMAYPDLAPTNFGVSQQYLAGPSSINGDISMTTGASLSTMARSSSNQMANSDAIEKESATVGVLEDAGPSRIDTDSQPVSDDDEWFKLLFD